MVVLQTASATVAALALVRPTSTLTPGLTVSPPTASVAAAVQQTTTFLTHDWSSDEQGRDNHARVSRANDRLKQLGVVTWFDADRMTGHIRDKMAEGIANTSTVVVFVTQNYMTKVNGLDLADNCKFELDYAFRVHGSTKIIPVVMEPRMCNTATWSRGAGSALLCGMLYVDMTSDDPVLFEAAVQQLKKHIDDRI
jgi:hypothetical protein